MDLKDALIPAFVQNMKVEHETHNVSGMDGFPRQIAGRRHIKLEIELLPRNNEELNWLTQSLKENGMRVSLVPDGSPLMHPTAVMERAITPIIKTDQPKNTDSAW